MSYCETARPNSPATPVSRWVRTTAPTSEQEPVTLAEAKAQCGVADSIDAFDGRLRDLIATAREAVEHDTGIVCYTGTFTTKLTTFPVQDWIELHGIRPVTSITSITYVDTTGTTQTWGASNYTLDTYGVTPFVRLAYGQTWPVVRGDINGITITAVAGYSTVLSVPHVVKAAVLLALQREWHVGNGDAQQAQAAGQAYEWMLGRILRSSYP